MVSDGALVWTVVVDAQWPGLNAALMLPVTWPAVTVTGSAVA